MEHLGLLQVFGNMLEEEAGARDRGSDTTLTVQQLDWN